MTVKRIFVTISIVLFVFFIGAINAFATIKPAVAGDADLNYEINIKDATLIQKFVAQLEEPNGLQKATSEVDGDGRLTVKDATMVQKRCAGLIGSFVVSSEVFRDLNAESLIADYDSEKAMVGVPVTFTATAEGFGEPYYYQFFVNGEEVTEITEKNTYTCTFEEAGVYDIKVKIVSSYGITDQISLSNYKVVEFYESETLVIKSFYYDKSPGPLFEGVGRTVFLAEAMFGSGVYEYAFYLDGELVQSYSSDNAYVVDDFREANIYTLTVYIRDLHTGEVVSQGLILVVKDMIVG